MARARLFVALCTLVALGAVASAADAGVPSWYSCTGGSPGSPAVIPAGTYSGLFVSGTCTFGGDVTVNGTVVVAAGAVLNDHAAAHATETINGNVLVGAGGILGLGSYGVVPNNSSVSGSIFAVQPRSLYLSGMTVGGSVNSNGGGTGTSEFRNFPIKDNTIGGNLVIQGWRGGWMGLIRNHVGGNVIFANNKSVVVCTEEGPMGACLASAPGVDSDSNEVQTNWIAGNLICVDNTPAAQVNPLDGGQPNVVGGRKIGECAGL